VRFEPPYVALLASLGLAAVIAASPATTLAEGGGGGGFGGGGGGYSPGPTRSPEKVAERAYAKGLKKRDNAWGHEEKAAQENSDKKRRKSLDKAAKDWKDATKYFREAASNKPDFHQAYSSLGYALRKRGQWDKAIAAYDRALDLDSRYAEAIEYRAEAFLALHRLEDVTREYMRLFALDREKARLLMSAMEQWLEEARTSPPTEADVSAEQLESFHRWVESRKQLAAQVRVEADDGRAW
jgi:tetratricopeptide (TPR) repeat protein